MSRITQDKSNMKMFKRLLGDISKQKVKVGFFREDGKYKDTFLDIVDLAKIHEFGVRIKVTKRQRNWFKAQGFPLSKSTDEIVIPEQAFLRSSMDKNESKIVDKVQELTDQVVHSNGSYQNLLQRFAEEFADVVGDDIEMGDLGSKVRYEVDKE